MQRRIAHGATEAQRGKEILSFSAPSAPLRENSSKIPHAEYSAKAESAKNAE